MSDVTTTLPAGGMLESLLSEEAYRPVEPKSLEDTGVSPVLIETLILKHVLQVGSSSGRNLAKRLCLPFAILEELLLAMRSRQLMCHKGQSEFGDFIYTLTELGTERARTAMRASAYVGPVPVPLEDYVVSVEAQTIRAEAAKRAQLEQAFAGISVDSEMLELLGPAVNSGAGMFLYGAPGNGKTTIAKRITACFGQHVWVPKCITEDGLFIKFYDSAFHEPIAQQESSILKVASHDTRWIKIRRPTVVVGGELSMDSLEVRHDPATNVSEASLQMKSNCGSLLIDDFGRQRIEPTALLNRWIVPLENRVDFLTLSTGKKICVPFEQLIIFSTNLEPQDLADDAFLRRIPYKIEIGDPSKEEFTRLFQTFCGKFNCPFSVQAVEYLIQKHYLPHKRPLRRCHPRDLLTQIHNYCVYNDQPMQLRPDIIDRVVRSYFTAVGGN